MSPIPKFFFKPDIPFSKAKSPFNGSSDEIAKDKLQEKSDMKGL